MELTNLNDLTEMHNQSLEYLSAIRKIDKLITLMDSDSNDSNNSKALFHDAQQLVVRLDGFKTTEALMIDLSTEHGYFNYDIVLTMLQAAQKSFQDHFLQNEKLIRDFIDEILSDQEKSESVKRDSDDGVKSDSSMHWISVMERLPTKYDEYLVTVKHRCAYETEYHYETVTATSTGVTGESGEVDDFWTLQDDLYEGQEYFHVTHWMEFPSAQRS